MDAQIVNILKGIAGDRIAGGEPEVLSNDGHMWSGRVYYHHPDHGILTLFVRGYFVGGRNLKSPAIQSVYEE